MPLYEYHCEACEKDVELLVQRHDASPRCPQCGSERMKKLLSVVGSPVIGERSAPRPNSDGETCGRPQCARGCMFGN